ncbi:hypothetical protein HOC32_00055 [Candidatus Woesearchaeota archaeon]|nr:hypothetical protein [Candidatus Woesearchaeota archaeon]
MPEYVPFHTIVSQPPKAFKREFAGVHMGNRDMSVTEYAEEALKGNIDSYRGTVIQNSGFGFYHQAPKEPHWVVTPKGESQFLRDLNQVTKFYQNLPEEEQKKVRKDNDGLAQLL